MANTGRKIYQFLKQIDLDTGLPTGVKKANVIEDPDYAPPVTDYVKCPTTAWEAASPSCITEPQCAAGWTLVNGVCQRVSTTPATQHASGNLITGHTSDKYGQSGGIIIGSDFNALGVGTIEAYLTTPHFWVNGAAKVTTYESPTRTTIEGRANVRGIWSTSAPLNEWLGFTKKFTNAAPKTYYLGISGDERIQVRINGVPIITLDNGPLGVPNFRYWNIYPITMPAGDTYLQIMGMNTGSIGGSSAFSSMSFELYDMTKAQLIAATSATDLNVVYHSREYTSHYFEQGMTIGWSCPDGWYLDNTGSGNPVCRMNEQQSAFIKNTGMKSFATRKRITNGAFDGYSEPNLQYDGIGPYFPPVQDLINCPIT